MSRAGSEVLDRLGPRGLSRVLDDVLDQTRLARLATACGLTYKGIRTRSQKRERLVADLVEKAGREDKARTTILRTLKKETTVAARAWGRLDADERERRLNDRDYLLEDGRLGLHLFLLAATPNGPGIDTHLEKLGSLRRSTPKATAEDDAKLRRQITRLKKRTDDLSNKIRHLEQQLARSRETEKGLKKDLVARKGELAEARMLGERLRRDLERRPAASRAAPSVDRDSEAVAKAIRKLSTEQRKLTHALTKALDTPSPEPAARSSVAEGLPASLDALRGEIEQLREDRTRDVKELLQRVDDARDEIRRTAAKLGASASTPRRRGAARRVGVFVDVQNVWYGARQLKGKLDFDALIQAAVRDRRLIQATAYVVESKEIDQSGFIARLQQRAITVRRKTLEIRSDGSMKGDWDMEMALDILDAAPNLDVVVLVSGDGDFTSLVKRVKKIGPRVEVVAFPRITAKSLVEASDGFQPLDRKFMIRTPKSAASTGSARASRPATSAPRKPSKSG